MKKLLATIISISMVLLVLSGCGSEPAEETPAVDATATAAVTAAATEATPPADGEKMVIGVAAADFNDKWMSYLHDSMQAEADAQGVELIIENSSSDINKQLATVENFVTQGVDAIIMIPVNTDAVDGAVKAANEADIPIIFTNRVPANMEGIATYVGSDSVLAGEMQMEYIAEQMGGKGNLAILIGDPGNEAAIQRTQGVKNVLEKYPDITVVAEETGMWQRDKGMAIMETWLQAGLEIDAVASNNDEMAIGALNAIEADGLLGQIIVGGTDATPDALQTMKEGKLDVTVFQNAEAQGGESVKAAIKAANGETLEPYIDVPFELVTPENVDTYIAKWQ